MFVSAVKKKARKEGESAGDGVGFLYKVGLQKASLSGSWLGRHLGDRVPRMGNQRCRDLWEPLKCAEEIARRPRVAGDYGQGGAWWEVSLERAGGRLGKELESHC